MHTVTNILLVEANRKLAQQVIQAAEHIFNNAVWHISSSLTEAITQVESSQRFALLLIDHTVLVPKHDTAMIESFVRQLRLTGTPMLLLGAALDSTITSWAYTIGFSACHTKPATAKAWGTLLEHMHRYWFTINMVPRVRPGH